MLLSAKGSLKTIHHRYLEIKGNIKSPSPLLSEGTTGPGKEHSLLEIIHRLSGKARIRVLVCGSLVACSFYKSLFQSYTLLFPFASSASAEGGSKDALMGAEHDNAGPDSAHAAHRIDLERQCQLM